MPPMPDDLFREPGTTPLDDIVIRELRPDDLDAVVRIDQKATGHSRREYYHRKLTDAVTESGIRISLAAEVEGQCAGFLLGRLYYGEFGQPETTAIVDSIGVDPAFRRRQLGRALMTQLEMNMRGMGIESIQTHVEWNHYDLLRFLDSMGFAPEPVLTLQKKLSADR